MTITTDLHDYGGLELYTNEVNTAMSIAESVQHLLDELYAELDAGTLERARILFEEVKSVSSGMEAVFTALRSSEISGDLFILFMDLNRELYEAKVNAGIACGLN